jgi:predicted MFS family arabinose efflux permease
MEKCITIGYRLLGWNEMKKEKIIKAAWIATFTIGIALMIAGPVMLFMDKNQDNSIAVIVSVYGMGIALGSFLGSILWNMYNTLRENNYILKQIRDELKK